MIIKKLNIIILFFLICNAAFSQKDILQTRIVIPSKEYSAIEILSYIQQNSTIQFSYKSKLFQSSKTISYKFHTQKLSEILDVICDKKDLDFVVINGVVVIKSKKEIQKTIQKTKEKQPTAHIEYIEKQKNIIPEKQPEKQIVPKSVLSGKVVNAVTGELIIHALISIDSLHITAKTNEFGFFSIVVPEGVHSLLIIHSVHFTKNLVVQVPQTTLLQIPLVSKNTLLLAQKGGVDRTDSLQNQLILTQVTEMDYLSKQKSFVNTDPIKDLEKIPGVQKIGDGSSSFLVRGGGIDQNLVIIDDAPIFNPTHLFGFFSTFIPYSIKDIKVYKGDFSAQFGGRLSSLVDIRTKDGNDKKFAFFSEIGPIVSTVCVETPIVRNHAAIILNFRKSNLGWLLKNSQGKSLYGFYDGNVKLNFHITPKHRFYYSLYFGGDEFNELSSNQLQFGVAWQNVANSFRWNYIISPKLFSNFTVYASSYNYFLYPGRVDIEHWNSKIAIGGIKSDFTYFKNNENTIRFGIDASGYSFNPGNLTFNKEYASDWNPQLSVGSIGILSLYYSQEKQLSEKSTVTFGARIPISQNSGPSVYYAFDSLYSVIDTIQYGSNQPYNAYMKFEPRISYTYQFSPICRGKIAYAKTTQFIHSISNSETQITSLDIWLPSSSIIKPEIARQVSLGAQYTPFMGKIILISDLFYKNMQNQIYYANHANMLLNPLIEGELRFGNVNARGFECMIQQKSDKLSSWISYTYTKTNMTRNNSVVPTIADRPHDLSIGSTYQPTNRLIFEFQWLFLSGKPITTPIGYYEYQGAMIPMYNKLYNSRLPNYHRLDASAQFRLNKKDNTRFTHVFTLSIQNVYARKNPISVTYNKVLDNNSYVLPSDVQNKLTYVSTVLYAGTVMPIVTYAITFN